MLVHAGRCFTEIPQRDADSVNSMENLSQETGQHSMVACGNAENQGSTLSWCSFDKWFFCFFYSLFAICVVLDVYALKSSWTCSPTLYDDNFLTAPPVDGCIYVHTNR